MEASSNPRETQTDEVQHTASAGAPHQEQEGNLRLTELPKPKRLWGAARRRKRKAMAQAASEGGPAGAEGSTENRGVQRHRIANFPNYVTLTSSLTHHRIVNLGPTALRPLTSAILAYYSPYDVIL